MERQDELSRAGRWSGPSPRVGCSGPYHCRLGGEGGHEGTPILSPVVGRAGPEGVTLPVPPGPTHTGVLPVLLPGGSSLPEVPAPPWKWYDPPVHPQPQTLQLARNCVGVSPLGRGSPG